jgi:hypothetical protein
LLQALLLQEEVLPPAVGLPEGHVPLQAKLLQAILL